ncbi:GSCOCG00011477001-RA-CDS [Cotesia congregata]|uniref:Similar to ZBTB49: Zinc finger and BTB domain-containing protein 49 (Homo sapiens) n=1 Tax=Cotesia congregata TaxID=51543 RepID=A0A8J2HDV1_COTCN|nr:GSCOCG00011477001-RA-CDS [Cotesia congregata]CAG5090231.1 Similar to ZBTB49: Zinc finger and BTB domain-containing protein 49 (Homo sapiens) [Cotesia congregata]
MKELNTVEQNNNDIEVYSNGTTESTPDKKIKEEVTKNLIDEKNVVLNDNYNSIIKEGIYLIKEQVKLYNATMQYLLKTINLIADKKIPQKIISDYSSIVTSHNLLLDKDKINSEITLKIWNGSFVKSEESCNATIVENKKAEENVEDSTKDQSDKSPKIDKNSAQVDDDIEILNKSISSMDLNSSDELMNVMDVDLDPKQADSTLYSSLTSSSSPSTVILKKNTYPVNIDTLSNPVVLDNKTSKEIPLEVSNNSEEPNKKLSLIEVLKNANKSYSNMNRASQRLKRKAVDEEISLENNKKCFTADGNNDDKDNSSSQRRIIHSTKRKVLNAKIYSKKQEFKVPESFLPVVRLQRIKLPINEKNLSAMKTKVRKLETEKKDNVYNLRPSSRKNNCTEIKKINNIKVNCELCDKTFKTKECLKAHAQSQHVKKNFKCKKCNYASNFQGNLRRHIKIHQDTAVVSQSNLKTCLRSYAAKLHQRDSCSEVNRSKSSFKCSICLYTTKSLELLNEHTKSHNNNKLFNCNDCDKTFGRKKLLQEHRATSHASQSSRYSCNECQLTFSYYGRLSRHLRTVHGVVAGAINSKNNH